MEPNLPTPTTARVELLIYREYIIIISISIKELPFSIPISIFSLVYQSVLYFYNNHHQRVLALRKSTVDVFFSGNPSMNG